MRRCETKSEAVKLGTRLLKSIKAKGCTLRVHENIGWHFAVEGPGFTVFASNAGKGPDKFWALPKPSYAFWCPDGSPMFSDPNDAVAGVVNKMRSVVRRLDAITCEAEEAI